MAPFAFALGARPSRAAAAESAPFRDRRRGFRVAGAAGGGRGGAAEAAEEVARPWPGARGSGGSLEWMRNAHLCPWEPCVMFPVFGFGCPLCVSNLWVASFWVRVKFLRGTVSKQACLATKHKIKTNSKPNVSSLEEKPPVLGFPYFDTYPFALIARKKSYSRRDKHPSAQMPRWDASKRFLGGNV